MEWGQIEDWLTSEPTRRPKAVKRQPFVKKCPSIKVLENYSRPAPNSFWRSFPKKDLNRGGGSKLNLARLESKVAKVWGKMTAKEKKIAENAFKTLKFGADPILAQTSLT